MPRNSALIAKRITRFAAPVLLASALGACSSIPDWVDPTTWLGDDSQTTSDQSSATTDTTQSQNSGTTPDLASIPPKPTPPSTPDEQKQVSDSLAADRTQAQYSSEALEGGTEPAAAPPPAESATTPDTAAPSTGSAVSADQSSSAPAPATPADHASADTSTGAADNKTQPTASDASGTQVASAEPSSTTAPAAAPMAAATANVPPAENAQANFAPSHAPALDPSVAQYVPQRILSRYQQTATAAAVPGVEGMSPGTSKAAHSRRAKAAAQTAPALDTATPAQ